MKTFRKRCLYFIVIALSAGIAGACQERRGEDTGVPGVFSKTSQSNVRFGNCDTAKGGVEMVFELREPSDSTEAAEKIRQFLQQSRIAALKSVTDSAALAGLNGEPDLKQLVDLFKASYTAFKSEFPESAHCWSLEQHGDTLWTSPRLVIYDIDRYTFTGGAHPNSFRELFIFNCSTGEQVSSRALVSDTTVLLRKAEEAFRKLEGLKASDKLEEKGYFLKNGKFFLPQAMGLNAEGIYLYYNPYEIAAYVRGPIELVISYKELQGVLNEELIF